MSVKGAYHEVFHDKSVRFCESLYVTTHVYTE